jgi:ABC-2 type transport system permease protein
MRRSLKYLGALVATNLKSSVALRGAFLARVVFMFLNNFIFLVMWWVFFDKYESVRGWRLPDTAAVYGIAAGAFGMAVVLGRGVGELSRLIFEGDLDSFLVQPKSPLVSAVASRSEASGWGDMASAVVLFALSGYVTPAVVPVCLVCVLCGFLIFLATGVLAHSLAFWLGDTRSVSREFWQFLIIFAIYPSTVFSGWLKVVLFSVIPAGFVTFLPVQLLRRFDWTVMGTVLFATFAYCTVALLVFRAGLRRYESGNRFGVRA